MVKVTKHIGNKTTCSRTSQTTDSRHRDKGLQGLRHWSNRSLWEGLETGPSEDSREEDGQAMVGNVRGDLTEKE